jgi:ParB family chromosome partitioning protein
MDIPMDVITDFSIASTPKSEIAQRLAEEAKAQSVKLELGDKKAGTLRILSSGRGDLFQINPYLIRIREGWNSREANSPDNIEHVDNLARSIAEIGIQQPLSVMLDGDTVFVTDGHCRLLATFRAIEEYGAEIKSIPVRAENRFATEADRVLSQVVKNSGKPLTVIEMGAVFVKLVGFGWTPAQIAAKVGFKTPARVSQILDLMANSSDSIKSLVASGQVSATLASEVLRENGNHSEEAEQVLSEAVENAKAEGKTKATAKHIAEKASPKAAMKTIFESAKTIIEPGEKTTTITMPTEFWEQISKLFKIV